MKVQTHLTAQQIADLKLDGLPRSAYRIRERALAEGWDYLERPATLGGRHFSIAALPEAARADLLAREAAKRSDTPRAANENRRGRGRPSWWDEHPEVAEAVEAYLCQRKLSSTVILDALRADFSELPTGRTLRRFIKEFEERRTALIASFRNPDQFKGKHRVSIGNMSATVTAAHQIWEIDTTPADVMTTDGRKAVLGLALTMWGGKVVVISTHNGADNAYNELIEDIRSGKREGVVQRVTLKDALRQGLYQRICLRTCQKWSPEAEAVWEASLRKRYGAAAEQELDVVPSRGSGIYLARATIEQAMSHELPVIRLACPDGFERHSEEYRTSWILEFLETEVAPYLDDFDPTKPTYFGQDFARNGDVSPIVFGQRDDRMRRVARFLLEMRNVPFKDQELILNWIISRVPMFACGKMDARGNGSALAEAMQQRWGFDRVEAVQTSEKTYLAYMPKLRSAIEDQMLLIPWDEGVMDDLRMIKLVRGIPMIPDRGKVSKADGDSGKRHGDDAIALMHFVAASDEDIGPMEFYSAGQRSTHLASGPVSTRGFGSAGARAGFVR